MLCNLRSHLLLDFEVSLNVVLRSKLAIAGFQQRGLSLARTKPSKSVTKTDDNRFSRFSKAQRAARSSCAFGSALPPRAIRVTMIQHEAQNYIHIYDILSMISKRTRCGFWGTKHFNSHLVKSEPQELGLA